MQPAISTRSQRWPKLRSREIETDRSECWPRLRSGEIESGKSECWSNGQYRVLVHDPAVNLCPHKASALAPFHPAESLELYTAAHRALTADLLIHIWLLAFVWYLFCLVQSSPTFSHWGFNGDLLHVYRWFGLDSWVSARDLREGSAVTEAGNPGRRTRCGTPVLYCVSLVAKPPPLAVYLDCQARSYHR